MELFALESPNGRIGEDEWGGGLRTLAGFRIGVEYFAGPFTLNNPVASPLFEARACDD